jgi:DNA uptake protein ComE-like DNA-binding protein
VTSTTVSPAIVHVNRAGVAELASLPGIGQRKAEKIVAARAQGPLRNLEEMARAAGGIPQTSRDRMQPFVRFED